MTESIQGTPLCEEKLQAQMVFQRRLLTSRCIDLMQFSGEEESENQKGELIRSYRPLHPLRAAVYYLTIPQKSVIFVHSSSILHRRSKKDSMLTGTKCIRTHQARPETSSLIPSRKFCTCCCLTRTLQPNEHNHIGFAFLRVVGGLMRVDNIH